MLRIIQDTRDDAQNAIDANDWFRNRNRHRTVFIKPKSFIGMFSLFCFVHGWRSVLILQNYVLVRSFHCAIRCFSIVVALLIKCKLSRMQLIYSVQTNIHTFKFSLSKNLHKNKNKNTVSNSITNIVVLSAGSKLRQTYRCLPDSGVLGVRRTWW